MPKKKPQRSPLEVELFSLIETFDDMDIRVKSRKVFLRKEDYDEEKEGPDAADVIISIPEEYPEEPIKLEYQGRSGFEGAFMESRLSSKFMNLTLLVKFFACYEPLAGGKHSAAELDTSLRLRWKELTNGNECPDPITEEEGMMVRVSSEFLNPELAEERRQFVASLSGDGKEKFDWLANVNFNVKGIRSVSDLDAAFDHVKVGLQIQKEEFQWIKETYTDSYVKLDESTGTILLRESMEPKYRVKMRVPLDYPKEPIAVSPVKVEPHGAASEVWFLVGLMRNNKPFFQKPHLKILISYFLEFGLPDKMFVNPPSNYMANQYLRSYGHRFSQITGFQLAGNGEVPVIKLEPDDAHRKKKGATPPPPKMETESEKKKRLEREAKEAAEKAKKELEQKITREKTGLVDKMANVKHAGKDGICSITHAGNTTISQIPETIATLSWLTEINFNHCSLSSLPDLGKMQLQKVNLSANKFEVFPKQLLTSSVLSSLRILDFSMNKLQQIPKEFENCSKLQIVDLSHNFIKKLCNFDQFVRTIEAVDLTDNNLSTIPVVLAEAEKLWRLKCMGNPLHIPPEVCLKGLDAIKVFLKQMSPASLTVPPSTFAADLVTFWNLDDSQKNVRVFAPILLSSGSEGGDKKKIDVTKMPASVMVHFLSLVARAPMLAALALSSMKKQSDTTSHCDTDAMMEVTLPDEAAVESEEVLKDFCRFITTGEPSIVATTPSHLDTFLHMASVCGCYASASSRAQGLDSSALAALINGAGTSSSSTTGGGRCDDEKATTTKAGEEPAVLNVELVERYGVLDELRMIKDNVPYSVDEVTAECYKNAAPSNYESGGADVIFAVSAPKASTTTISGGEAGEGMQQVNSSAPEEFQRISSNAHCYAADSDAALVGGGEVDMEAMLAKLEAEAAAEETNYATPNSKEALFYGHKTFLRVRNPYFSSLLSDDFFTGPRLSITDSTPDVFDPLLHFMYSDSHGKKLTPENAINLLFLTQQYQCTRLQAMAEAAVGFYVDVDNVGQIIQVAYFLDLPRLKKSCMYFAASNFSAVKRTEGWKNLEDSAKVEFKDQAKEFGYEF